MVAAPRSRQTTARKRRARYSVPSGRISMMLPPSSPPVCLDIAHVQDFITIAASFQSEDCPQLASHPAFELPNRFAVDAERTAAPTGAEFLCLAPIIHAGPVVYWRWKYIA